LIAVIFRRCDALAADLHVLGLGPRRFLALLGSALGCVTAFILGHLAMNMSYLAPSLASSQFRDTLHPEAFVFSSLFLIGVALAAGYAPARRALHVDPASVLQNE
jgi:ABC-type lipoprotein release transport system permease subunit